MFIQSFTKHVKSCSIWTQTISIVCSMYCNAFHHGSSYLLFFFLFLNYSTFMSFKHAFSMYIILKIFINMGDSEQETNSGQKKNIMRVLQDDLFSISSIYKCRCVVVCCLDASPNAPTCTGHRWALGLPRYSKQFSIDKHIHHI